MKRIKQKVVGSIFVIFVLTLTSVSMAAFQSQSISTVTAEATVTGGELAMSVEIRNRSNDGVVSSLTWNVAAGDGWTLATQYILLHSTLTVSGGGNKDLY